MAEVPELRATIRAAAERRYGAPRRLRRQRVAAGLTLIALSALGLSLLTTGNPQTSEFGDEVSATPSAEAPRASPTGQARSTDDALQALGSTYGVFRRPARDSDRLEPFPEAITQSPRWPRVDIDWGYARRVASLDDRVVFAVPAVQQGTVQLCTATLQGSRPAGWGCGPYRPDEVHTRPFWSKTFAPPGSVYFLMLPDGTQRVDVEFISGAVRAQRVQSNGVLLRAKGLKRIRWLDANGVEHSTRAAA